VGKHRLDLLVADKVIVENKAIFIPLSPSQKRSIP